MKMIHNSRKIFGVTVSLLLIACSLSAAVITQEFGTGAINPGSPGSPSVAVFAVNQFNSGLGTLTSVTFTMTLETWGGYYTIVNATAPSTAVSGTMFMGANAYLFGMLAPSGSPNSLSQMFAGETDTFNLAATGDSQTINGPAVDDRNTTGPESDTVSPALFNYYQGTGSYEIRFVSSTGSRHEASGAVNGSFGTMSSQGYLTVSYEYEPVPEPTSLGLVLLGVGAMAVRRRSRRQG